MLKTKTSRTMIAAAVAMLSVSCADENPFVKNIDGNTRIIAEMEATPQSRTCIDQTPYTSGEVGLLWEADDSIGVYSASTTNALFINEATTAQANTGFRGNTSGDPLCAYYPYNAANASADRSALKGTLPVVQMWNPATMAISGDYKYGRPTTAETDGYHFAFRHIFSLLKIDVDASGTGMQGEQLDKVTIAVTSRTGVQLGGDFTFDLTDVSGTTVPWSFTGTGGETIAMKWTERPVLDAGSRHTGYMSCAPAVKTGDKLTITVQTSGHVASFTVEATKTFEPNAIYNLPLTLASFDDGNHGYTCETRVEPVLTAFSFTAELNKGKILDKEAYYNGSTTTTRSVDGQALTVDNTAGTVSGCIPYLFDFNLVPTFTVPEGMTVTVDGQQQTSGSSAQDFSSPVTYTVHSGSLTRDYVVTVTNTGRPVVVLTGGGDTSGMLFLGTWIPPKTADFGITDKIAIYDKEGGNNLAETACGFRIRGNSTSNFPKKPMAIKLTKKNSVLGMPKHKRWCLLANWIDRSLIRNSVAFDIADKVKNSFDDGLTWQPSGKTVELVLNGVHAGSYFLCEQIKIDENRLNIQDGFEDVVAPTTANCGYLLEFDDNYDEYNKFRTTRYNLPCMSKDKIEDDAIWTYVKSWVQDIENKLYSGNYTAAYEKLDINSVIDYWFIQELAMNREYRHPKSVYMYKDGEGKLFAGPVWDFDYQTFPNCDNINAINTLYGKSKLSFTASTICHTQYSYSGGNDNDAPYMWYPLLFKDATFKARVKERWAVIYPNLQSVTADIERLGRENKLSDHYNQLIWPIESKERTGYSWYIDFSGDERLNYDALIENFKTVYTARLNTLNSWINNL